MTNIEKQRRRFEKWMADYKDYEYRTLEQFWISDRYLHTGIQNMFEAFKAGEAYRKLYEKA